jgi:hypothetical protein
VISPSNPITRQSGSPCLFAAAFEAKSEVPSWYPVTLTHMPGTDAAFRSIKRNVTGLAFSAVQCSGTLVGAAVKNSEIGKVLIIFVYPLID